MEPIIEVAKSGRAGCRTCRKPIAKGELRFGEVAPNQFGEVGEASYRWHHLTCAAQKPTDELRAALAAYAGEIPNRDELEKMMAEAEANKPPPFPYADKAPTGRARCQGCGETIPKGAIRVAVEREIERGGMITKGAGYLHPACAAAYVEANGGTHAALTEALTAHTRDLSDAERDQLFSEV
jgi:poly [ADP-ribose] polymerase